MSFIEWSDQLSVKIPSIDRQHKVLIGLINKLDEAAKNQTSSSVMDHTLHGLINYTIVHFTYEEGLFEVYQYPAKHDHTIAHQKLAAKVTEYKSRFEQGDSTFADELNEFLKNWLTHHIMKEDMAYSDYLSSAGVK